MSISDLQAFLNFKKNKLDSLKDIESKRLDDLKDAREKIFKYALPSTIIDGVGGVVGTLITGSILILLPIILFILLIYFLAENIDRKKLAERIDIMEYTQSSIYDIRRQEIDLLRHLPQSQQIGGQKTG